MAEPQQTPLTMTADAFLAWNPDQEERFELIGGQVVKRMTERAAHSRAKTRLVLQVGRGIPAGSRCQTYINGLGVRVSDTDVYEPDVMIHCGDVADDDTFVTDPTIVFEILSPSTAARDIGIKVPSYLALPSVTHVVLIDTAKEGAVLFDKAHDGLVPTILPGDAQLTLALPSGEIVIDLGEVFRRPAEA